MVEFRSRKDYERWLATWGNRVAVMSTATSGHRYTVTYNGPDTTAKNGKRTRNPFVKLLQIGAAVVVGGFLMLAALGNLDTVIGPPVPCANPAPRCLPPTALPSALPSIAGAVVLRPEQFILPAEQFPLSGYSITSDIAVGTVSWTRVWTTSGGTPFYWVEVDATVLEPSATSNDAIAKTTCNWTFTTPMLKAAEVTAPVVGDGAKACAYDSVNGPASTMTYTTGTRNTLITVSANRLSASQSATTNFLASLADYQLWTIDKVAPAPGMVARSAPSVQIPPVSASGGGTASLGGGGAVPGGSGGGLPPIDSSLPAGFPTDLPSGTYALAGCIFTPGAGALFSSFNMTWGHCNNGVPTTITSGHEGPLVQTMNAADPCAAPGCVTSYTGFNGTFFDTLHKTTDCSSGVCGVSYVLLRVTKH